MMIALAISLSLFNWTDVDQDCAGRRLVGNAFGFDSVQAAARLGEQHLDRRLVFHRLSPSVVPTTITVYGGQALDGCR
jgi:hypothetical protein